jgi:hypothetical protein
MRLFKLITTSLLLGMIWLFLWQNSVTFRTFLTFSFDLYIREPLQWKHQLSTLLLLTGFLGFLIGIAVMLKPYFNIRRLLAQERQQKPSVEALPPPAVMEKEEASESVETP